MADPLFYWVFPAVPEECEAIVNATWERRAAAHRKPGRLSVSEGYVRSGACPHVLYGILSGDNEASIWPALQHHLSEFYTALGVKRQVDAAWPRTSTGGAQ